MTTNTSNSSAANKGAFQALPVINVAGLFSDSLDERQAVAGQLGQAAREVGFFYVTGHGISAQRMAGIRAAAKAFFAQPFEAKMDYYIGSSASHKGFVPRGEEIYGSAKPDLKEAFDVGFQASLDHPLVQANTPLIGPNEWPPLADFKQPVLAYYDDVFAFGRTLFRGFALALGLDEHYFDAMVTCPPSKLRLIHYPYDASAEDAPGIGAHTDYECFTMLLADQPGLEVLNEDGDWIDAPPVSQQGEEAFVINIGDMLEVMTAGQFVATSHRVRKVSDERYSFPLFFACDYHTQIQPLPQFLQEAEASEYEALSIGDHMYSQALQTYSYLRDRVAAGELSLPQRARGVATFGHMKKKAANSLDPECTASTR
ncbi:isopenicillin N synthase family dioxygenase [Oceanobacter kriegii]|uniref:isopenicillin N synthase family dioxygenase n=1 Tax=Oceanobacter kriegii TaxID=64972 RepID=UPI0003F98DDC|nr:2-oxoglutarate and iron-dependent oxygenase domain-containing protein [Oceanobacter kriegii]